MLPSPTGSGPSAAPDPYRERRTGPARSLRRAVLAPVHRGGWPAAALAVVVLAGETVGLLTRLACRAGTCGPWATVLDMDALGSLPRLVVTAVLAAVAVVCLVAVGRAGRGGAAVWWSTLAAGAAVLAAAKHWSVHSLLEERLGAVLPGADVQLLFLATSLAGLGVAVVSGRWVRTDTRTSVVCWLGLYALAAVGLAAVTVALAPLGAVVGDVATWVEETGEGLAAVGLLAAVRAGARDVARRRTPVEPVTRSTMSDPTE